MEIGDVVIIRPSHPNKNCRNKRGRINGLLVSGCEIILFEPICDQYIVYCHYDYLVNK